MNIPLQQTREWQKLQEKLGEKTFFEETSDYTYLAIKKTTKFGDYLYLPYGPYAYNKSACSKAVTGNSLMVINSASISVAFESAKRR